MIQHENNLKPSPSTQKLINNIISFQQGLTQSIFTVAPNTNRVKLSVQNLGENDVFIYINGQVVSIIAEDFCQFIPDTEAKLSIGVSSPLGSQVLVTSYLSI